MRRILPALFIIASVSACNSDITGALLDHPAGGPQMAKPSSGGTLTTNWEFFDALTDATPSAIRSDGLGVYRNAQCGVRTRLFTPLPDFAGDATLDPDADYNMKNKCTRRAIRFAMSGTTISNGAFVNARLIWDANETLGEMSRRMQWNLGLPNCDILVFGNVIAGDPATANGSQNVTITRLADSLSSSGATIRIWTVQSNGDHRASCASGGVLRSSHVMPFRLRITQAG